MSAGGLHPEVLAPLGFAAIGALGVLLGVALLPSTRSFLGRPWSPRLLATLAGVTALAALLLVVFVSVQWFASGAALSFDPAHPLLRLDRFSAFASALIGAAAFLACALATYYLEEVGAHRGEYYALLLLSATGMLVAVAAVDLLALFVGLELTALPLAVLAGFKRGTLAASEAGTKLFVLGGVGSALFLYGAALLYGATGSTALAALRETASPHGGLVLAGLGLVLAGLAFRIGVAPFHQWVPDAFEGGPAPVSALLTTAGTAAGVLALVRLLELGVAPGDEAWVPVLTGMAVLSMLVGATLAAIQGDVRRLLAYGGIAHAGILLLGVASGTEAGAAAVLLYLVAHTFASLGAFGIVAALGGRGRASARVARLDGLARSRPGLAALLALFLLSLAGTPLTAGFFARFAVLAAAIEAGHFVACCVAAFASVVLAVAYLRIVVAMYMREPGEFAPAPPVARTGERVVLVVCSVAVLALGVLPEGGTLFDLELSGQRFVLSAPPVAEWARQAVIALQP